MLDLIHYLDAVVLGLCNGLASSSPAVFYAALSLSSAIPWTVAAVVFAALWFTPRRQTTHPFHWRRSTSAGDVIDSRRAVLLLLVAMALGFVVARGLVQTSTHRLRPSGYDPSILHIPISADQWHLIKAGLDTQGSFPSDHAVMFAVVAVAAFLINRWVGSVVLVGTIVFSVMRVGVGFHWPTDMLGGAVIGALFAGGALACRPSLKAITDPVIRQFDYYPSIAYSVGILVLVDISQKFSGLFGILSTISGRPIGH